MFRGHFQPRSSVHPSRTRRQGASASSERTAFAFQSIDLFDVLASEFQSATGPHTAILFDDDSELLEARLTAWTSPSEWSQTLPFASIRVMVRQDSSSSPEVLAANSRLGARGRNQTPCHLDLGSHV
jgi:hypothetical protein